MAYGTTNAYGSTTAVNSTLVTSHSVTLSALLVSTTYHYQALSQDAQGNLAASGDYTFTTAAPGTQTVLQFHADATEVSGVSNGSTVMPATAPPGFSGSVVANGSGSVNFAPAEAGNGVYFLNCCGAANNAYYRFTGAMLGNIFNVSQGQITFYLKSRYSFAQRQASASSARYAFEVKDANGSKFYFFTQITSGYLNFTYMVGGAAQYYFVPHGSEDTLFGNGVALKVTLSWNGTSTSLSLNDNVVKTTAYTPPAKNWTAASVFDLGAQDYFGTGYNVSDDVIDEFTVLGPAIVLDTTPPTISLTAPTSGATVTGTVTLSATATDNVGVTGVQFQLDGGNLGAVLSGAGPGYTLSWDTTASSNGSHTLTAVASDAAGNQGVSSAVTVTVNNPVVPPVISGVAASSISSSGATITWSTDKPANSQVAYGTTSAYGSTSALNSSLVTSHSVTLAGLAASTTYHYQAMSQDAQGNLATSADFTFTTTATAAPPAVSITAPGSGSTLTGTVTVTANATSTVGIASVQFQLDGTNLGAAVTGSGPSYSTSWNTTTASNGNHMLTAQATDTGGNSTTSGGVTVTVSNTVAPPVISGVTAGGISASGATITWTTSTASSSQVAYGTTSSYGSLSTLNSALVTSHSATLAGLAGSTTYHYQAMSQDAQGNLATSGDFTFTTTSGPQIVLLIQGNASEASGTGNGAVITPSTAPAGFTGTAVVNGSGSINFSPAQVGNGVYFLNCCANSNNAYYQFTSAAIGNIFNVNSGQVSFNLQSRYSFAQRQASAASPRYTFDVRDGNGNHLFYFLTEVVSGNLIFTYQAGTTAQAYYVPRGTEDTLFGLGVNLQVTLAWGGTTTQLYLNNNVVKTTAYTVPTANWTAASSFDLGAYQYLNAGGYSSSDDVINQFTVASSAASVVPPNVSVTAPGNGSTLTGTETVTANATSAMGIANVQFKLDGVNLGAAAAGSGPSYSTSWDTTTATNGSHALTAVATDTAGNTATSAAVTVTVSNTATPPVISGVTASGISASGATITWSTSTASSSQVAYGITSGYGSMSALNSSLVTSHSATLAGLVASTSYHYQAMSQDAQGNLATSGDFTFTTTATAAPPAVSITAPGSGSTLTGTVTVTANATSTVGIASVQFQLDGTNLGAAVTGSGPSYSTSWNTTTASNGNHMLTAQATDTGGNSTTSAGMTVTVSNTVAPPVISGVTAGGISASGATITWTTSTASSSQVSYGTTSSYGSLSTLNSALVTSHSATLAGLAGSTTYHYQAMSQDAQGNLATSGDFTFTTTSGPQIVLLIQGNASEASGTGNGAVITPSTAPAGFTGTAVVNGSGSINFSPAQVGNGVYFLNCCANANNAYYQFTSAAIGNIFNVNSGQVSFNLQSRYSFAQRQASAASPRYTFDVRDGNGNHLFYFLTEVVSGNLIFTYQAGTTAQAYYVPRGTEDTLLGLGVNLQVTLAWGGTTTQLYLNNNLVKTTAYTVPTANWTAASSFDLGAYNYLTVGSYNVSDDIINEFTVEH